MDELNSEEVKAMLVDLSKLGPQLIELKGTCLKFFSFNNGWMSVDREDGKVKFMWTSGKDYHNLRGGRPCQMLDISDDGKLLAYYRTALTLHMIWGYGKGTDKDLHDTILFVRWLHEELVIG